MKAWVLREKGDIALLDTDKPKLQEGEVLIRVMAAGICGSDIPRIYETGAHRMPLIPGHEFSGVVEETGSGADKSRLGKRVTVCPKIPCGKCASCRAGRPDSCTDYDYTGSRRDGAFAEYVAVPADRILELPDNVSYEEGAMTEPFAVAVNAVRTALEGAGEAMAKDDPVAVCGSGTIGLMVAMLLREAGFQNIHMIGNKDSQRDKALSAGIASENFINSRSEDAAARLREKTGGVRLYFECVGRNESIEYGLEAAAPEGRLILIGNPASDMSFKRDTYWRILRKQLSLKGIWNSSFRQRAEEGAADDWHYALEKLEKGSIPLSSLITHRFGMDELYKGFHIMRDKTEDYTKVMMTAW